MDYSIISKELPMYNEIMNKLIELDYIHFIYPNEFMDAVKLLASVYYMQSYIIDCFDKETFNSMINSAILNITKNLTLSFGANFKKEKFIKWFNDTYMNINTEYN